MESFDVLVVGGGVAGASAALAAARHGCRTGLVRPSPGVSALAGGGWRGPMPAPLGGALADAGLPYTEATLRLPHLSGALRRFDAAPAEHAAAALEEGALVCGIAGLPGVRAGPLARLWGEEAGLALQSRTVDAGEDTPAAGWSPASLAAALDRRPGPLAESVARSVREAGAPRALLPPVLGLERSPAVRASLEEAAGVPVGEMLAVPPVSVPGWRLDRALLGALAAAGVAVVRGRVVGRERDGARLLSVRAVSNGPDDSAPDGARAADEPAAARTPGIGSANPDGPLMMEAKEFVLATGKFAARGLTADGTFREGALDCPVWIEHREHSFDAAEPLPLTHAGRGPPQPLLLAGVRTDAAARPVDRRGGVVYRNVRVAGSIRAGSEAAALGLGGAAEDGWSAGELAGRGATA